MASTLLIIGQNKDSYIMNEENKKEENIDKETEASTNANVSDQSQNESENGSKKESESGNEEQTEPTELDKANKKIAELEDKYLRQAAEFDNFRRRVMKEKAELILNGGEKVLTSLLPVVDDLERAQQHMASATDVKALKEGIDLIIDKFNKLLKSQGVKEIETKGKDFDVNYHEAITMIPSENDEQKGKIVDCVSKGYTLNDKVIRYAKVVVAN